MAAYKVGASVTAHQAWGVGSYCYFNVDTALIADHSFKAPGASGVQFHDLVIVSLGGVGTINHIINEIGGPVNSSTQTAYLVSCP